MYMFYNLKLKIIIKILYYSMVSTKIEDIKSTINYTVTKDFAKQRYNTPYACNVI